MARSRDAMLAAARQLLEEEGPAAVTHQRVAARAGVGRATVYRHWPGPEHLLRDAMATARMPFFADYHTGLHDWLQRELRRLADELAVANVSQLTATMVQNAQRDQSARQQLRTWLDAIARRVQRASTRPPRPERLSRPQSLATRQDSSEMIALLVGPVLFRILLQGDDVADELLQKAICCAIPPARS